MQSDRQRTQSRHGWFLVGSGDDNQTPVMVTHTPYRMGRGVDCDLVIPSRQVSRQHAALEAVGDRSLQIVDSASANGTFVNGIRIRGRRELLDGDSFSLGPTEGIYRIEWMPLEDRDSPDQQTIHPNVDLMGQHAGVAVTQAAVTHNPVEPSKPRRRATDRPGREQRVAMASLIRQQNFFAMRQPLVCASTREVQAYELLTIGTHPALPKCPASLLELAGKLGVAAELSRAFRRRQVELSAHPTFGAGRLFLNVHPDEIEARPEFMAHIGALRSLYPQQAWALEIHESTRIKSVELRSLQLELENMNIHIAFDDFGSEQSRLVELLESPPAFVKFDVSLTRGVAGCDARRDSAIRKLIEIVSESGAKTIAEGIETEDDARACTEIGFDWLQGYAVGRPAAMAQDQDL